VKLDDLYGVSVIRPVALRFVPGPKPSRWVRVREWFKWTLPEFFLWWLLFMAMSEVF